MSDDSSSTNLLVSNKAGEEASTEDNPPSKSWYLISNPEIESLLKSNIEDGLTNAEVEKRLQQYGTNTLTSAPGRSALSIFIAQFQSLIVVLLIIAAIIAFIMHDTIIEGTAILIVIILNAVIGFFTELRAEQAITALQEQNVPIAHVIRNGDEHQIPAAKLVPGDLVVLSTGERVPADGRIIESIQLQIQEASLTGESLPVNKTDEAIPPHDDDIPLGDRINMGYMGTVITGGRGLMMVTSTGMSTEIGKIGTLIDEAEVQDTPLERRLEQLGRALIGIVGVLCIVIVGAGVWRGEEPLHMLEVGISLAIAAVPEGLPAVATMTLALGVQRMAKKNGLVRRLPAVETLGSTTVICTDKTGTLTKNEMTVTRVVLNGDQLDVTGSGYETQGSFLIDGKPVNTKDNEHLQLALKIATLCNDAELERTNKGTIVLGDPTEGALIVAGEKAGLDHDQLEEDYERIDEVPFDSETKRMVTVHRAPDGKLYAYMKGSQAVVMDSSPLFMSHDGIRPLTQHDKDYINDLNRVMAEQALRVLAVAYRELPENYTEEDLISNMTYVGLFGMIDPLRDEAKLAIEQSHTAGIRTIMITGDQPITASEIARQLGLDTDKTGRKYRTVHARELDNLDEAGWDKIVSEAAVFARVSPEHKLRIVESLQKQNQIVAMTGDGVNDAPALRKADIGVAMGIKGTEVAKETADMIISDDNFATIVQSIEQGRMIYSNIQRFIHYLFSCNLSEILTVFTAIMLGWPLPLVALQILWLNIITDVFPALALALEPSAPNVMKHKPRDPKENLLNRSFATLIAWQGLLLAGVTLTAFYIGMQWYGTGEELPHAITISFMTLALSQTFHAFNARSQMETVFNSRLFSNKWLWGAIVMCVLLQVAAVNVPFLQQVLGTVPISMRDWALIAGLSLLPIGIVEIVKLGTRLTSKNA